ncbi:unnamed protein product [Alternaria alternata]
MFVAVVLYSTVIKRALSGLTAQFEKAIFWLGGFWIGALSNYTFDWIPISRLTAHDLEQQPGAKIALAAIIVVLAVIIVGQVYYFWLEGRLLRYLGLYGIFVTSILICLIIPGVNLRIHHYILAMLLLPGTSLQTRPSLLYQGILLGLFVNGIARWDFDSVLQTSAALRDDAKFNSVVPKILNAVIESDTEGTVATFSYDVHPIGVNGQLHGMVLVASNHGINSINPAFIVTKPTSLYGSATRDKFIQRHLRSSSSFIIPSFPSSQTNLAFTHYYPKCSNNVNAGVQLKAPTDPELAPGSSTCTTVIDCPTNDKCRYLTNSKSFIAECNYDYYGGDIALKSTDTMTKCVDECAIFPGCVAVTWVDSNCYLKNNNTKIVYNNDVDSVVLEV